MKNSSTFTRILFVEDDPHNAAAVKETLQNTVEFPHTVTSTSSPDQAIERLRAKPFDLILLELVRIDSAALLAIRSLDEAAPETPIIILCNADSRAASAPVFQLGVQECLEKETLDPRQIVRAIQHSIERHRIVVNLRNLSMLDPLTGLYNRRGFLTIAKERISQHAAKPGESPGFALLYGDLDELKLINDHLGHPAGDAALKKAAEVLQKAFPAREDIIARIGGDEYLVLTRLEGTNGEIDRLLQRVDEGFYRHNAAGQSLYAISMTIGVALSCGTNANIPELIEQADTVLRKRKQEPSPAH